MRATTLIAPLLLAACAGRAARTPAPQIPPAEPAAAALSPELAEGKQIFETVCATCHTVAPPPRTAPPMSHVAAHYRQAYGSDEAAVEKIVAWVPSPAVERSALPEQARSHWGLMAPLLLPDDRVRAVARYVMTLRDTTGMGGKPTQGMMHDPQHSGHTPPR